MIIFFLTPSTQKNNMLSGHTIKKIKKIGFEYRRAVHALLKDFFLRVESLEHRDTAKKIEEIRKELKSQ